MPRSRSFYKFSLYPGQLSWRRDGSFDPRVPWLEGRLEGRVHIGSPLWTRLDFVNVGGTRTIPSAHDFLHSKSTPDRTNFQHSPPRATSGSLHLLLFNIFPALTSTRRLKTLPPAEPPIVPPGPNESSGLSCICQSVRLLRALPVTKRLCLRPGGSHG